MRFSREQLASASAWISQSARVEQVVTWHRHLCSSCERYRLCPEYYDIIADYGIAALV